MSISTSDPATIKAEIRALALKEGFESVGFSAANSVDGKTDGLYDFLARGHEGEMAWLAREPEKRARPTALWPEARTAIALGQNYGPDCDPRAGLKMRQNGVISVYARGRDYHDIVKKRLKRIGRHMAHAYGTELKVFVDTAPVMEKPLASAAGLGWQGKHTNLVSRDFGSWLFLGIILTTLDLPPDQASKDHCGNCDACLKACPTSAFTGPYQIDARRCVSYLTIEHKGHIAPELRQPMGNRIYGCDDCLAVCPWNKFASEAAEVKLQARAEMNGPDLASLSRLDDQAFRARFSGSPIKRTGRDRFVRNVLIAIGNSGDPELGAEAMRLLGDPSSLVRAMAVWALSRLLPAQDLGSLADQHAPGELDPEVTAEWKMAVRS